MKLRACLKIVGTNVRRPELATKIRDSLPRLLQENQFFKHALRLKGIITTAFALLTASSALGSYNVLFIAVDDLRPELNCYGAGHIVSPGIDRLAQTGRLFRHHYVSVPTCGASRYSLMTGKRPATAPDTRNSAFHQLPASEGSVPESFAHMFRRNGWRTVSIGKVSHEPDGFIWNNTADLGGDDRGRLSVSRPEMPFSWDEIMFGHDRWGARANPLFNYANGGHRISGTSPAYEIGTGLGDDDYLDGQIAAAAISRLEEFKQDDTRFMMAVGFFRPHLPFNAPESYYALYEEKELPAPFPAAAPADALAGTVSQSGELGNYGHGYHPGDPVNHRNEEYRRKLRKAYFASVSYVDAQIGRLLDALDSLGLAENTVVVLWGDHGWCLDDYGLLGKHVVLERALHAPLIIRAPGMNFPGRATDGIVETIDIYPTLAKLCGLTPPAAINGTSLVPMLNNPDAPGKGWAYSRQFNSSNQDSVRTERWRLVRVGADYDLYDLHAAPYEVSDVSNLHPGVVNDLAGNKLNVQASRAGTLTYESWKTAYFSLEDRNDPSISGPDADPDFNGIANILEYFAGTNPKDSDDTPRLTPEVRDLSGYDLDDTYFTARFTASALVNDLSFSLKSAARLGDWSAAPLSFVTNLALGEGVYEYLFREADPIGSREQGFIRLTVEQSP